jgi:hypothetical protein
MVIKIYKTIKFRGLSLIFLFYLRRAAFWKLDSITVFRWNLLIWAQSIELVPIFGHQHQHKIGYINQAQPKPSERVKINITNIKRK